MRAALFNSCMFFNFRSFKFSSNVNQIFKIQRYSSSSIKFENFNLWEQRLKTLLKSYEDMFGITKLAEVHEEVLKAQSRVSESQMKRRKVQEDLFTVQLNLQEIQAKLQKVSRGDDMFLSVVTEEHELLKEQKRLQSVLAVYDQTEREEQTALAVAINISQDHERTYREKTKYLSLITGVIGGFIGVVGSSINNWKHKKDIKTYTNEIANLIKEYTSFSNSNLSKENLLHIRQLETVNAMLSPDGKNIIDDLKDQISKFVTLAEAQEATLCDISKQMKSYISSGKTISGGEKEIYSDLISKKIMAEMDTCFDKKLKVQVYANSILSCVIVSSVVLWIFNKIYN